VFTVSGRKLIPVERGEAAERLIPIPSSGQSTASE
jgi:hypothetical protein